MNSLILFLGSAALIGSVLLRRFVQTKDPASVPKAYQSLNDRQDMKHGPVSNNLRVETKERNRILQTKDKSDWKTRLYKDLYFKLQNLEYNPDILPLAQQTLF